MPYLNEIVEAINTSLSQRLSQFSNLSGSKLEGIAFNVVRNGDSGADTVPAVIDEYSVIRDVIINDTYPMTIYHRVSDVSERPVQAKYAFGDQPALRTAIYSCKMIAISKVPRIKMTHVQLYSLLSLSMPAKVSIDKEGIDDIAIEVQGGVINHSAVFNEEYRGSREFVGIEDIMISITYQVTVLYNRSCINICGCGKEAALTN
jgi:hypothetical protein